MCMYIYIYIYSISYIYIYIYTHLYTYRGRGVVDGDGFLRVLALEVEEHGEVRVGLGAFRKTCDRTQLIKKRKKK